MLVKSTHTYAYLKRKKCILIPRKSALAFLPYNMGSGLLTLVLLNRIYSAFANGVDPDQLASEEAN